MGRSTFDAKKRKRPARWPPEFRGLLPQIQSLVAHRFKIRLVFAVSAVLEHVNLSASEKNRVR
jgi:hypothetical protein